jgi:hypothetical protein
MGKLGKHGGARPNSGRKSKAEELALIEKLGPMEEAALTAIARGVQNGEFNFVNLYMQYRFGKPTEKVQVSGDPELPIVYKLDDRFKDRD